MRGKEFAEIGLVVRGEYSNILLTVFRVSPLPMVPGNAPGTSKLVVGSRPHYQQDRLVDRCRNRE